MTNLTDAIMIAVTAHRGQFDKSGQEYILHPLRVMLKAKTLAEKIVSVLHDVVEDTEITLGFLRSFGFSEEIVEAIDCLTKRPGESLEDSIRRASQSDLATKVKFFDINDNLDPDRLCLLPIEKAAYFMEKYSKSISLLVKYSKERTENKNE